MTVWPIPEALSPSSTSTFQNCPLQFRFQNIQKLPQPPSVAAVKGNVVHRALELLFGLIQHYAPKKPRLHLRTLRATSLNLRTTSPG